MTCRITNIKDPKHAMLVGKFGVELGTTKFLEEYGKLTKFYESKGLSAYEVADLSELLDNDNDIVRTNHSLLVNDGKMTFKYGTMPLKPGVKYNTELEVNWGDSLRKGRDTNTLRMPDMNDGDLTIEDFEERNFIESNDFFGEDDLTDGEVFEPDALDDVNDMHLFNEEDFPDAIIASDSSSGKGINKIISDMNTKVLEIERRVSKMVDNVKNITTSMVNLDSKSPRYQQLENNKKNINIKIQEYKNTIKTLKDDMDEVQTAIKKAGITDITKNLRILFNSHKEFAKKINAMEDPDPSDLILAINGMKMWAGIRKTIWDLDAEVDDFIVDFLGDIESLATDSTYSNLVVKQAKKFVESNNNDFGENIKLSDISRLKDVWGITAMVQSLGDTSNKILQSIDKWVKEVATRSNMELFDFKKKTITMFDSLRKAKINPEVFLDKNPDGSYNGNLIGRFNQTYYHEVEVIEEAFTKELLRIKKLPPNVNMETRNAERTKAILAKNKAISSRSLIIDPTVAIDPAKRGALKAEITKITGDENYAEERLIEAQNKYERYLEDLQSYTNWAEMKVGEEGFDGNAMVAVIAKWKKEHSPIGYSKYIKVHNVASIRVDMRNNLNMHKYSVSIPLDTINGKDSGYYNRAFTEIMKNSVASKFYYDYTNLMQQMLDMLPSYSKRGLHENFLAHVRKEAMSKLNRKGARAFFSGLGTHMIESITSDPNDFNKYGMVDSTGKAIRSVPIRFMGGLSVNERNLNLEDIINEFAKMAISYKHITLVEDKVALAMNVLQEAKAYDKNPDGTIKKKKNGDIETKENALNNSIEMAQYSIDHNFYGVRNKVEGFTGWKFFNKNKNAIKIIGSVNPVPILEEYNAILDQEGPETAMKEIKKKYKENVIFVNEKDAANTLKQKMADLEDQFTEGKILKQVYDREIEAYQASLRGMGRNVVLSKIFDTFINFSYYKAFAWNPFPGVANIAYGNIAIFNHAVGGEDFNRKQAVWGMGEARKSSIMSIRSGNLETNKLYNLMNRLGIVSDIMDGLSSQKKNNISRFGPMGLLSEGDYLNRAAVLAAMMKHDTITDINGKTRPLYEAFNSDGTFNVAEFGNDPAWTGRLDSYEESGKTTAFVRKVKAVNKFLHGNMDPETAVLAKKTALGRALAQYRLSWMIDGFASRFQSKRYDENLERFVEGRITTVGKFAVDNGIGGALMTMLKLMAFQGDAAFKGKKMKAEDRAMIMANVKKAMHEMYLWSAMWGAYILTKASIDDDDKDKGIKYVALNTLWRIMGDISFYISPGTFEQIINNPIPAMSIMTDFNNFTGTMTKYLDGDNEYYDEEVLIKNFTRQFPVLNLYNKWEYRSARLLNNQ